MSIIRIKKEPAKADKQITLQKTEKLIKVEIKNKEVSLVDKLVPRIEASEHKWSTKDKKDTLVGQLDKKGTIIIYFPKDFDGDFTIEIDKIVEPLFNSIRKFNNMNITPKDVEKSIFKMDVAGIKGGAFSKLGKNKLCFIEIENWFKSLGFKTVGIKDTLGFDLNNKAFSKLSLILTPNMEDYVTDKIVKTPFDKYEKLKGFVKPRFSEKYVDAIGKETIKDIILHEAIIGKYYADRNLVILFFSPFEKIDLENNMSIKEIEYLVTLTADVKKSFEEAKIKQVNNEKFLMLLTIKNFNKEGVERLKQLKADLKMKRKDIHSYEETLIGFYNSTMVMNDELTALLTINDNNVEAFTKQLEKLKKVPIVTNVKLEDGTLHITFKETTVKTKFSRDVEGNNDGPIKEMFIGAITCSLKGGHSITVSSNYMSSENKAHPHADVGGLPCLGSGDGPNMMYKLIGQNNFADFVYVFWMWIRTWRSEDCYISPVVYYDDRLKQGLPVFDQVGNRIKINDPKLIKSGEQVKLEKASNYEENFKKYKNYKSQP